MIRAAIYLAIGLIVGLFWSAAYGQTVSPWPSASETVTVDTPLGPIVLSITNTQNADCPGGCPDLFEIVDAPPGIVGVPSVIDLGEMQTGEIRLMAFEGV